MIFFFKYRRGCLWNVRVILIILSLVALTGCESIHYYNHLISGQINILNKNKPIHQILDEPHVSENLKTQLRLVLDIREFANNELCLPVKNQYLSFVDLQRPFAVWNVYATPEFSFAPKTWCYPVVGCTSYRGYFSKQDARDSADKLKKQGYDVFMGGVAAYSTLGWFDDPVLSTFVYRSHVKLAALIFHELAHQLLYVEDDTTFNESFATAVEQEGLRRWLATKDDLNALTDYQIDYQRHRQFVQLVMKYRKQLESLYAKDVSTPTKRDAKALIFDAVRDEYRRLKQQWEGYSGYDLWFSQTLNNAQLISVSTYYDLVPEFLRLLQYSEYNLELFYKECRNLAQKTKEERRARLQEYLNPERAQIK
ncbi:MAG: aminopeptidase [Deltaproteobacteria bacterium]|nr:aminopeptidase [Deltaproteobacteria bacterium]MBW2327315.1 aminopeptidase [Deltaproteobacteria bacterium]